MQWITEKVLIMAVHDHPEPVRASLYLAEVVELERYATVSLQGHSRELNAYDVSLSDVRYTEALLLLGG